MDNGKLTIYKASAGSGKTFRLALEYIKLLIADPQNYQHILAVTFTNDATGEMKKRILMQLDGLKKDEESSREFREILMKEMGISEKIIQAQASVALSNILHDYTRFYIRTIDSFFQVIIKNLAHDLGLPPNQQIIIDNTSVLEEAVDRLIETIDEKSPLLNGIKDLVSQRVENDQRVDIARELKGFGKLIFDEEFIKHRQEINKALEDKEGISAYNTLLYKEEKRLKEPTDYLGTFERLMEQCHVKPTDLNRVSSIFSFLKNVDTQNFAKISATIDGYINEEKKWLKKSSPAGTATAVVQTLLPFIKQTREDNLLRYKHLNTIELSRTHINQMRLLNALSQKVHELTSSSNSFLLSDTPGLIHELVAKEDSPFIFEKTGTQLKHVMIDEFQDTSELQWENFNILLDECLANGQGSLLVGDVKQSIYRWRNSDWNILNNMQDGPRTILKKMACNYRSDRRIIDFNNELFTLILQTLAKKIKEESPKDEEFAKLVKAYSDVIQQCPEKKPQQGYVNIQLFEGNAEKGKDWMLLSVLWQITSLREQGVQYSDIMILVRRKADIEEMAAFLSKQLKDVTIISDDAFQLNASLALQALISALHLVNNPNDKTSLLTLASIYQKEVLKYYFDWQQIEEEVLWQLLPASFKRLCHNQSFRMLPLYELLERLIELFNLGAIEKQDAYLFTFFDQVTQYLQSNPSDIANFLNYWDETLCYVTAASNAADGIRIKTIHKAKGLEFHTVIIPYCHWNMESNNSILCPPIDPPSYKKEGDKAAIPLLLIDYGSKMQQSCYVEEYEKERMQQWVDNLNLLYVAFTRPKSNLFILGRKNAKGYSIENLLKDSLEGQFEEHELSASEEEKKKNTVLFYEAGSLVKSTESTKDKESPVSTPDIHIKSYSKAIEFRESNRSKDFIAEQTDSKTPRNEYIERGKLLHKIFSSIHTTEDIDPILKSLEFEGIIGSGKMTKDIRKAISNLLKNKEVCEWFSDKWNIRNECNILTWQNGEIEEKRPDRVMIGSDETIVVDFKFGSPRPEYEDQVRQYVHTLINMGYPKVKGYLWYVFEGNEVKQIDA